MRSLFVAGGAAFLWLVNPALSQKGDAEIGVLTCSLEEPASAPAIGAPAAESHVRDAICTFKPTSGSEETYVGVVQGVTISADKKSTVIWRVKADVTTSVVPAMLQQSYAIDNATPADQLAPMIGESNSRIVLQSLTDKQEGSASAAQKPAPSGYVIIGLQLKLRSAAG
jgi:hypothetical protein